MIEAGMLDQAGSVVHFELSRTTKRFSSEIMGLIYLISSNKVVNTKFCIVTTTLISQQFY